VPSIRALLCLVTFLTKLLETRIGTNGLRIPMRKFRRRSLNPDPTQVGLLKVFGDC